MGYIICGFDDYLASLYIGGCSGVPTGGWKGYLNQKKKGFSGVTPLTI